MLYNCGVLEAWAHSAKSHPEMQEHTAAQFASAYRKLAYEVAIKDAGFYASGRAREGSFRCATSICFEAHWLR